MTPRPLVGDIPRLGAAGSAMSDRRNLSHDGRQALNLVGQHAATIVDTMLTVNEHQFLADFALHVHQRLMRSRGTGPHPLSTQQRPGSLPGPILHAH